jgi:two-component system chemotaxis sensor kinase CheA
MDDLLREVIDIFVAEAREQADRIAQALLTMEQQPASIAKEIEELYRQAHSLKGSSASLGVEELSQLAHQLESALLPVRRQRGQLTAELVDLGLQAMDAVKLRVAGLQADNELGLSDVQRLTNRFEQLAHSAQPESPATTDRTADAATEARAGQAGSSRRAEPPAHREATRPTEDEQAETAFAGTSEAAESVRVSIDKLSALVQHTDALRRLRGQLEHHQSEVTTMLRGLEKLVRSGPKQGEAQVKRIDEDLQHLVRGLRSLRRDLMDDIEGLQSTTGELDDGLRAMQLLPASLLSQPLHRAVREACRSTGKEATLQLDGEDVFLDRTLLEAIKTPLLHVVRNAVDHGIEPVEVREAVGKPAAGQLRINIEQRGSQVELTVTDDGRGLDVVRIREVAQQRGLLSAKEAALLDENESYQLLLRPGFSTKEEITALSGRGVGLDVVSTTVRKLHGTLGIESAPGAGTTFTISVPLTVAASRVLMLEEQDHTFALPLPAIARIALPRREELATLGSQTVFYIDGQPHTVLRLSKLIGQTHTGEAPARQPLLQLRGSGGVVIACDRLRGEADLVLRPLPIELRRYPLLSSVAIVPSGPALFVLSPQGLLATATSLRLAQENLSRRRTVLVADDSITTRSLLRSVLEGGGYRVRTASDGDEALRIARSERIDLVVSDVRMPRLDGIGLLLRLRGDARTSRLPLVLFSGAQSEEDRLRGLAAGASAYLAKSDFERGQLVDVVTQLLKEEAT